VELNPTEIDPSETDEDHVAYDYTVATWKLLTTLLQHERLAKYVKELEFDISFRNQRGEERSGLEATKPRALSTFLRLGSNIFGVCFHEAWGVNCTTFNILKNYKNVIGLRVDRIDEEEEEFCAQHLSHLKRFSVYELTLGRNSRNQTSDASWKSLVYLDLWEGVKTITELQSFSANFSTIRTLGISLQLALDLDYSQFPLLQELTLKNDASLEDRADQSDGRMKVREFWRSLCTSPSLRTLGLGYAKFTPRYEEALFRSSSGGPPGPIPTLRSIRFHGGVRIDRAYSLLSGPLAATLRHVYVPSGLAKPGADLASSNKLGAVAFWCEAAHIELVLVDKARNWWTMLCTSIYSLVCHSSRTDAPLIETFLRITSFSLTSKILHFRFRLLHFATCLFSTSLILLTDLPVPTVLLY
jgi:hypothetical protein